MLINYDYSIENQILARSEIIKDLSVIFDSRLTFRPHLDSIISRANRNWYFIYRHTKEFKNVNSIRILYLSLVRSILSYASTIWRPIFKCDILRLERIQHKALRRIASLDDSPIHRFSHDYSAVSKKYNIPSLYSFFDSIDCICVYKIMSNTNRNNQPFYPPIPKNIFSRKDPIYRLCFLGNKLALLRPSLIEWNLSNNVASNIINLVFLNYD